MPAADFLFVLECSGDGAPIDLIGEVVSQALIQAGSSSEKVPELGPVVRQVSFGGESPDTRFEVSISARSGLLEVVVSSGGERVWQTSQPIS